MASSTPDAVLAGARLTRDVAASAGGAVLAQATRALATVRPAAKPLHPRGVVLRGRIYRHGSPEPVGVPWLDEPGEDDVQVRLSRAIGLPSAMPDIHGLAVRVGSGDLLFASTGWGRLSRFVLTASRDPRGRPMTTLLPYRTDAGPVLLGARAVGAETFELAWAHRAGDWQPFAVLRLSTARAADQHLSFDPVRHQVDGLQQYPSVVRLREPSYVRARRSRT
ncbi:hypothetical protein ABLE68_06940 [Nocardioides sp. CN2-186]|uniref:hypothetical protein n=1 Tax=Nocardioides tweenelious TaxID=3156607 RepID=UPI0032B4E6B4